MVLQPLPMGSGNTLSLRTKNHIAAWLQWKRSIFHGLAKWAAAMGTLGVRPDIQMGIEIDDSHTQLHLCVTQKMPKGGFVASAKNNRYCSLPEQFTHDLRQAVLAFFQIGSDRKVSQIQAIQGGQINVTYRIPRGKPVQAFPNRIRCSSSSGAASVATNAFITTKPDNNRLARPGLATSPLPTLHEFSQPRIIRIRLEA